MRDIYGDPDNIEMPVPVRVYDPRTGSAKHDTAQLVVFDAEIDIALLVMKTDEALPYGARHGVARVAPRAASSIFDQVYAVGCPAGQRPDPHGAAK